MTPDTMSTFVLYADQPHKIQWMDRDGTVVKTETIGPLAAREGGDVIARLRELPRYVVYAVTHDIEPVLTTKEKRHRQGQWMKSADVLNLLAAVDPPRREGAETPKGTEPMALCVNERCHLMREHTPAECGWPVKYELASPTAEGRRSVPPEPQMNAKFEQAREATAELRDATREGRTIHFRKRDPLVLAIHDALDEAEATIARLTQERGDAMREKIKMAGSLVGEKCEHHKSSLDYLEYHALRECPICWKECAKTVERQLTDARQALAAAILKLLNERRDTAFKEIQKFRPGSPESKQQSAIYAECYNIWDAIEKEIAAQQKEQK